MIHRRSTTSKELLKIGVEASRSSVYADVTLYPVEVAVLVEGVRPVDTDYLDGTWETIDGVTYACLLLGPGGALQLAATDEYYVPWVRIDTGTEKPEIKAFEDVIEVY